ncbi:MAG: DJ-1/PfpI family protein [Acidimicrobiales bacterium]
MESGEGSTHDHSRIATVLFEGFEPLDVFGPLEVFGVSQRFDVSLLGPDAEPVRSSLGQRVVADLAWRDAPPPEIVLVPGGIGTRRLVEDDGFLSWLSAWSSSATYVTSVCTGSGVLARAGLLDGYRATSNKQAFAWATSQSDRVEWVAEARWVADRDRWTSSGVAAGMDMALALVAHLHGETFTSRVADGIELEWHRDATWDPFAARAGLDPG